MPEEITRRQFLKAGIGIILGLMLLPLTRLWQGLGRNQNVSLHEAQWYNKLAG